MRLILALLTLPLPAAAWEFSADPICTLTHQTTDAEIAITYDAALPEYALFITLRTGTWGEPPAFQIGFLGGRNGQIGTTQHRLSGDGATLSVRDSGFGNVLDGLEFNADGFATTGATTVDFTLTDAAPAVRAFRDCPSGVPATS
ncbi:excinuclease ABC subunit B [Octadecabacter sp. G9-8]|uniref:Excinuclease ABC subunit B n=1 Tax=Octadecabacter dasysiphoniae TaxID=2909341 RepID=A0ABS9CUF5_9RHOB|nr:excinuclease ABC subunit B [Octadecabacter dasysiphoniae]MCF2870876.1 excinuclease ABC subunit B [Octadecabacter dasysiphoniae]